ncbi:MAG: hypothetical protein E6I52_14520, partial [Chloroflexi bacterium]
STTPTSDYARTSICAPPSWATRAKPGALCRGTACPGTVSPGTACRGTGCRGTASPGTASPGYQPTE